MFYYEYNDMWHNMLRKANMLCDVMCQFTAYMNLVRPGSD